MISVIVLAALLAVFMAVANRVGGVAGVSGQARRSSSGRQF